MLNLERFALGYQWLHIVVSDAFGLCNVVGEARGDLFGNLLSGVADRWKGGGITEARDDIAFAIRKNARDGMDIAVDGDRDERTLITCLL